MMDSLGQPATIGPYQQPKALWRVKARRLHEIFASNNSQERAACFDRLMHLIYCQASLHLGTVSADRGRLEQVTAEYGHNFRGLLLTAVNEADNLKGGGELTLAYAIDYPAIDASGKRGLYLEDVYVERSVRGCGLIKEIFRYCANSRGIRSIRWSTDSRNSPFIGFIENKLGAALSGDKTYLAGKILSGNYLQDIITRICMETSRFVTIPIEHRHAHLIEKFKLCKEYLLNTGDIEHRGFLTFAADDKDYRNPLAVTPAWPHMSTFNLNRGLIIEKTTFDPKLSDQDRVGILLSLLVAAKDLSNINGFEYIKMHMPESDPLSNIMANDLIFPLDYMDPRNPSSELLNYNLTNGKLAAARKLPEKTHIDLSGTREIGL